MMVEGTVEVAGTVKIDRREEQNERIVNYLKMCKNAHEASDTASVVEYSDKILEIAPNNYEAWMYRALSCGWGSSLNNLKTGQVITAAKQALDLAPEELRYDLAEKIYLQGKMQIVSHLSTVFSLTSTALLTMSLTMASKQAEMVAPVMAAWVRLATEIPYLSPEIMEQEIKDCKEVEEAHTVIIGTACRCFNAEVPYHEAMQALLKEKIEAVGKEREAVYARKREEYWAAHAEEKQALEARKAEAESRRAELLIPSNCFSSQIDELNSQIEPLQDQLNSLGMFKVKQIKVLSDQVDELRMQLAAVKEAAAKEQAAIQDKVRELDDIISEIDAKLLTPFL